MTKPSEEAPISRPFQYSLKSLLVITTVFAVLLGLAKSSPRGIPGLISFMVLLPLFTPFVLHARWLLRNGQTVIGLGIALSGWLILLTWFAIPFVAAVPDAWDACSVIAVGVISLPFWSLHAMAIGTGARRKPLRQLMREHRAAHEEDETG